jgi:AraC-like DNA-binding protein
VLVRTFPIPPRTGFGRHTHGDHQLAWAPAGVLTIGTDAGTWVLPPSRALWIPAGVPHEVFAPVRTTMRALYLAPARCPIDWPEPQPVTAGRLLAELIHHLGDEALDPPRRERAEAVLVDLLEPVPTATIEAPLPADERAREVAVALLADPADQRSLDDWGRLVGASRRTLARAFQSGTGLPFGRWRVCARLRAALPGLAAGEPVGVVSRRVGYESPSAFVAAFRRETGLTPGAYFQSPAG